MLSAYIQRSVVKGSKPAVTKKPPLYGVQTMVWLSPANVDSSSTKSVSKQEVDAKLDAWEMLGAHVRKERPVGYSVRGN